jgi:hypothetical protein
MKAVVASSKLYSASFWPSSVELIVLLTVLFSPFFVNAFSSLS